MPTNLYHKLGLLYKRCYVSPNQIKELMELYHKLINRIDGIECTLHEINGAIKFGKWLIGGGALLTFIIAFIK